MEEKKNLLPHRLVLDARQAGCVTGVRDVSSFDEKEILLFTDEGKLQIKGDKLHVRQLNLEKGEVELSGRVDSLIYLSKGEDKSPDSLFKRLFR